MVLEDLAQGFIARTAELGKRQTWSSRSGPRPLAHMSRREGKQLGARTEGAPGASVSILMCPPSMLPAPQKSIGAAACLTWCLAAQASTASVPRVPGGGRSSLV